MSDEQNTWGIGLSAWIIQDGNYPDFAVDQRVEFALEFHPQNIRHSESRVKSAKRLGDAIFEINAEVIFLTSKVWVLDFGISAFQESTPPKQVTIGAFVAAEICLGIEPFFYFERLHTFSGMPALIYSWKINSIRLQTAPFVETHDTSGRKVLVRDQTKLRFKTIEATDAWKDDEGHAEYILECGLLEVVPKHERSMAI